MTTRLWSVVFDANNPAALASFWAEALGWRTFDDNPKAIAVAEAWDHFPLLCFVAVPEPTSSKNRIHLDLAAADGAERDQIVDRLLGLGASRVEFGQPRDAHWSVLTDPEGNEFCVWPNTRDIAGSGPLYAISLDVADAATLGRFWGAATGAGRSSSRATGEPSTRSSCARRTEGRS